ncbi:putative membrane protein [Helicobacter pylori Hp P-2b]|uniref:Putative membrane protein n=1 Tax=Helicobacter pylori Hp P-2 TaxID=992073 RepID=I9W074_HELPX|nr:putative membrane protein [Helicobacter pylori Hp P-2]EJC56657.1 putative membrane protein [Helicobacter pylori Hp P-2b]
MFFQSCFLSDFIIDCLFLFRGLFFILLFFILYSLENVIIYKTLI